MHHLTGLLWEDSIDKTGTVLRTALSKTESLAWHPRTYHSLIVTTRLWIYSFSVRLSQVNLEPLGQAVQYIFGDDSDYINNTNTSSRCLWSWVPGSVLSPFDA